MGDNDFEKSDIFIGKRRLYSIEGNYFNKLDSNDFILNHDSERDLEKVSAKLEGGQIYEMSEIDEGNNLESTSEEQISKENKNDVKESEKSNSTI